MNDSIFTEISLDVQQYGILPFIENIDLYHLRTVCKIYNYAYIMRIRALPREDLKVLSLQLDNVEIFKSLSLGYTLEIIGEILIEEAVRIISSIYGEIEDKIFEMIEDYDINSTGFGVLLQVPEFEKRASSFESEAVVNLFIDYNPSGDILLSYFRKMERQEQKNNLYFIELWARRDKYQLPKLVAKLRQYLDRLPRV